MTIKSKGASFIRSSVALMIASTFSVSSAFAEETEESTAEEKSQNKLIVTGSRIKRTKAEGAAPVTVITSEGMEREGYTTVYEALRSLTESSGEVQGEQYTNSFTPNAQMINLRGFGPGYTLVLMNGKRIADYPMPYNGQSNFFNLGSIPAAAIERIEVMSGGASAIYGSDAVAGVINIITKTDIDDTTLSARIGTTTEGGGDTSRFQAVGGISTDSFNWTWAAEYLTVDPMFGDDREFLDSYDDRPDWDPETDVIRNSLDILNYNASTGGFIAPPSGACDGFEGLTLNEDYRGRGFTCGRDATGDESLRSERERLSIYNTFSYDLSVDTELYGRLLATRSEAKATGFRLWWGSEFGYNDLNQGGYRYLQRVFTPEETGAQSASFDETSYDFNVGLRGMIGEYDYDISLSHSAIDFDRERLRFKEEAALEYFMGQELTVGGSTGYSPNMTAFYTPLTPEITEQLTGIDDTGSESDVTSLHASISGDLFEMGGGMAAFAAFVESNRQEYQINLHPRLLNNDGNGWFALTGTGGGGERKHNAVGGEFMFPLDDMLTATVALRYDDYDDVGSTYGGVGGASTYNVGLEWRPVDELLVRAVSASTFRAPDMHYIFAEDSGFFTGATDYYSCLIDADPSNDSYNDCDLPLGTTRGFRGGNPNLEEETGRSTTIGMVFSPTDTLSFTMDYYSIKLENVIGDSNIDQFLRTEAECRTGQLDINSLTCQEAMSFITRNPADAVVNPSALVSVRTDPINDTRRENSGIDAKVDYDIDSEYGFFRFNFSWSHTLSAYSTQGRDGETNPEGYRDDMWNFNARSKVKGSINWSLDDWRVSIIGDRVGSLPRWDEEGRIGPHMNYNMTFGYTISENSALSLQVQNVLNTRPPRDSSFTSWPYFYRGQFNAIGRELFLTYTHKL